MRGPEPKPHHGSEPQTAISTTAHCTSRPRRPIKDNSSHPRTANGNHGNATRERSSCAAQNRSHTTDLNRKRRSPPPHTAHPDPAARSRTIHRTLGPPTAITETPPAKDHHARPRTEATPRI